MEIVTQLWFQAWDYKVSLLPVLLTYLLFDAQAIYRRITKWMYVPIYFMFFPSGHSDKVYAEYFNEDYFYGDGEKLTDGDRRRLRQTIVVYAIFSMIFATIVAPYICGMLSATYLTKQQFVEFLWFLLIVKSALIVRALLQVRRESIAVGHGKPFAAVIVLYVAYLYFVWRGLSKSFHWASTNIEMNGYWGLFSAIADIVHEEFFINIVAVSLLTWAVQQLLTSPENVSVSH